MATLQGKSGDQTGKVGRRCVNRDMLVQADRWTERQMDGQTE